MSRARALRRFVTAGLLVFMASLAVAQDGLRELMPTWSPGLEWTVEAPPIVFSMPRNGRGEETLRRDETRKVRVKFVVRGRRAVEGVSCHEVVATSPDTPDEELLLLVRAQDLSLKELRRARKTSSTTSVVSNDRTPFVLLETSQLCPFDLPLFPKETPRPGKPEERTFDLGDGRAIVQKITVSEDGEETRVELTTTWKGKKLVSTQTWKKGRPWWSACERTLDGKKDEWGTLDEGSIKAGK